jgi:hypothetical protein
MVLEDPFIVFTDPLMYGYAAYLAAAPSAIIAALIYLI